MMADYEKRCENPIQISDEAREYLELLRGGDT